MLKGGTNAMIEDTYELFNQLTEEEKRVIIDYSKSLISEREQVSSRYPSVY